MTSPAAISPCPLCCGNALAPVLGALSDDRFGAGGSYGIFRCQHCGLEQTLPRLGGEQLKALYEAHYNFGGSGHSLYARLREALLRSPLYRVWLAIDGDISFHTVRGRGRLLDIGCNEGRGLLLYDRNGFTAEGMELNDRAAASARKKGFTVHNETLQAFQAVPPYDAVVLSNVLEHVSNPVDMLRHVARILKPGGRLYVSCPNANSWQRILFGRGWINWHVPFHIVHFTESTLDRTLDTAGFAVTTTSYASPALWTAQTVISRLFSVPGRPTRQLRNPVLVLALTILVRGLLFPLLWWGNRAGRGDCLVVMATRR